jgi:hypothetical protein
MQVDIKNPRAHLFFPTIPFFEKKKHKLEVVCFKSNSTTPTHYIEEGPLCFKTFKIIY